jgi:ATP-dependent RNA helicase RhlE
MTFQDLKIIAPILKAIEEEGYSIPTPIQEQAIPVLFEGHDILGSAQTGTGKTAAFAVPIIQALYENNRTHNGKRQIQALVLAPTRELADQIKDSFRNYSRNLGIKSEVVYGGVSQRSQEVALNRGIDVLIATPGRLLDLMHQGLVNLEFVKYFVLDEADRMLDMGFIMDVNKIVARIPKERQTMLFSATIPNEILKLANSLLKDPVRIEVTPPETMLEMITQSLYFVTKKDKTNLLIDLLVNPKLASVLIFTRTKHGANKLVKELLSYGVKADAIHGNKSQNNRQQALLNFKNGKIRVLVATDIAARGIDIDELSTVINYDLPESPETYVHRMGRTGRAGLSGVAYTFCSQDEVHLLMAIEKHNKESIPIVENHLFKAIIDISNTSTSRKSQQKTTAKKEQTKNNSRKTEGKQIIKKSMSSIKDKKTDKQKKSYHALIEEQELKSTSGFKRSEQAKKRIEPVIIEDDEPKKEKYATKFVPKYAQKADVDRPKRSYSDSPRSYSGNSDYPKKSYDGSSSRPSGTGYQGNKPSGTGYQGSKPAGSGYQGSKPSGTGYQGSKPSGSGYQGSKPSGAGYQGSKPSGSTGYTKKPYSTNRTSNK